MSEKIAVVTGSSSGIGLLATIELAKAGFRVVASMRDVSRRERLDQASGSSGDRIDVRRLVGDLDVDIDGLRGDETDLRDDRHDERLAGPTVNPKIAPAARQQDLARVHAAEERGDDSQSQHQHDDDDDPCDDQRELGHQGSRLTTVGCR